MGINVSKVLIKCSKGSILDLDECYLCLTDVFFISVVYILSDQGQKIF